MKKVVIVEKNKTIREGIKILINRFSELECVDTFESFSLFKITLKEIKPDILLIDVLCEGVSIIDEIRKLKSSNPDLLIILLVMNEENEIIFDALLNGATAYLHKNAPSQKLVKVLEDTANGKMVINSIIARKTIRYIKKNDITGNYQSFELNLLKKVIEGNNLFAIEKSLKMSSEEIKANFRNIYGKLFLNRKTESLRVNK
jgi:DNA-binding NarL/FixJ family response regulator